MAPKIIVKLSEKDRLNNHVPDWVFELCHKNDVFYEDLLTGELVQILKIRGLSEATTT